MNPAGTTLQITSLRNTDTATMKPAIILLTTLSALLSLSFADAYQTPESALYDPGTQAYYVSNFRGHSISRIDETLEVTDFVTGLSFPLGLTRVADTLFAIDNPTWVRGFSLRTGEEVFAVELPEAQFLNDITADGQGTLYVTDSRAGHIYRIHIETSMAELLFANSVPGVNGILFDPLKNRLIACTFKNPAIVIAMSLKDAETPEPQVIAAYDGLVNLDGIAVDEKGNFLISTWGAGGFDVGFTDQAGAIYQFDAEFSQPPTVRVDGLDGPADIAYCVERKECLVPLFLRNEFRVIPMQ